MSLKLKEVIYRNAPGKYKKDKVFNCLNLNFPIEVAISPSINVHRHFIHNNFEDE
jgi:hypothetical protein